MQCIVSLLVHRTEVDAVAEQDRGDLRAVLLRGQVKSSLSSQTALPHTGPGQQQVPHHHLVARLDGQQERCQLAAVSGLAVDVHIDGDEEEETLQVAPQDGRVQEVLAAAVRLLGRLRLQLQDRLRRAVVLQEAHSDTNVMFCVG